MDSAPLRNETKPVEPVSTEKAAYFTAIGGPGWRCDFCGEIQWAIERPPQPQRCPRCGRARFSKTEVRAERVRVGRYR